MKIKLQGLMVFGVVICCMNTSEIPRDNSQYRQGESRYIWMPDGNGQINLVDLQAKSENTCKLRSGETLSYKMYSGYDKNSNGSIVTLGDIHSVTLSPYDAKLPLAVIIPDLGATEHSTTTDAVLSAFKQKGSWNIMVVDFKNLNEQTYATAVENAGDAGKYVALMVNWIIKVGGGSRLNVHLIGIGYGAHIAGVAGREQKGALGRITGLDPLGPLFENSPNRLQSSHAQYVEVFHTDWGVLGLAQTMGHIDYFPNGGKHPQPGCFSHTCSHFIAAQFFAVSVINDDLLMANRCNSVNHGLANQCSGAEIAMGRATLKNKGFGVFASSAQFMQ